MAITVYCSVTDIQNVGLPAAATENIPAASINEACVNASSVVDSYLGSTYTLPFTTINAALTQRTAEVAAWIIRSTGGMNPDSPNDRVIRQRYEDAIQFFERIAMRKAVLQGVVDSSSPVNYNPTPVAVPFQGPWGGFVGGF